MVANPANTNALILKQNSEGIPEENITCLTRLDHNRAQAQVRASPGSPQQGTGAGAYITWLTHTWTTACMDAFVVP